MTAESTPRLRRVRRVSGARVPVTVHRRPVRRREGARDRGGAAERDRDDHAVVLHRGAVPRHEPSRRELRARAVPADRDTRPLDRVLRVDVIDERPSPVGLRGRGRRAGLVVPAVVGAVAARSRRERRQQEQVVLLRDRHEAVGAVGVEQVRAVRVVEPGATRPVGVEEQADRLRPVEAGREDVVLRRDAVRRERLVQPVRERTSGTAGRGGRRGGHRHEHDGEQRRDQEREQAEESTHGDGVLQMVDALPGLGGSAEQRGLVTRRPMSWLPSAQRIARTQRPQVTSSSTTSGSSPICHPKGKFAVSHIGVANGTSSCSAMMRPLKRPSASERRRSRA